MLNVWKFKHVAEGNYRRGLLIYEDQKYTLQYGGSPIRKRS